MNRCSLLLLLLLSVSCMKTQRLDLDGEKSPLYGQKVLFFGDSVTEFTYNGKGLVDYFREVSGAITYKAAVGGSRFSQRSIPVLTPKSEAEARAAFDICNMVEAWTTNSFDYQDAAVLYLNRYGSQVQALRDCPINDADIVLFASGGNDLSAGVPFGDFDNNSLFTINGAINQIITLLLAAKPSLKVFVYSPLVGYRENIRDDDHWSDNYVYSAYDKTKPELINLIENRVSSWDVPYLNLYNSLGWNQQNFSNYYLDTDGTHPYKGFRVLGYKIYQELLTYIQSSKEDK